MAGISPRKLLQQRPQAGRLPAILVALTLGTAGGALADALTLPLSWMIGSMLARMCAASRPTSVPYNRMLSTRSSCGSKPVPRSMIDSMVPRTVADPEVGGNTPMIARSSELLPAPFEPTMPSVSPRGTSRDTPATASKVA